MNRAYCFFILKFFSSVFVFLGAPFANATIIWAGGEDIDFPNGASVCSRTNTDAYRTGYARAGIYPCVNNTLASSKSFPAGPITSGWLSIRLNISYLGGGQKYVGLIKSGTSNGLFLGTNVTEASKLTLWKYDGTTWSELASSSQVLDGSSVFKLDLELINYGNSATVKIYLNGGIMPVIIYNGDVTSGGAVNLDQVAIYKSVYQGYLSEFIVSTDDTRPLSLASHFPNAVGTTNEWSGSFSDVSESTMNDTNTVSTITSVKQFQCNAADLPSGSYTIKAVKVAARSIQSGSGISSISVGINADVPLAETLLTTWSTTETLYSTNPATASPWTPAEVNSLQINLKSGN